MVFVRWLAAGVLASAACASGGTGQPIDAAVIDSPMVVDGARIDAAAARDGGPDATALDAAVLDAAAIDARVIDAPPIDALIVDAAVDAVPIDGPPPVITSLLLSEVVLAPTGGELVEIVNPTAAAVDLSTYYIADAPNYWKLPAGIAAVAADNTDFVARFPAGATVAAHGVVTVAIDTAANFTVAYPTMTATYSIASATMVVVSMGTGATLTNAGEPIALFFWDGASDKVTDVDLMVAGTPTAANLFSNKSALMVDGPDVDTIATAYSTDANTLPSQTAPGSGKSTKRLALESTAVETQTGAGNGVAGHDETSELLNTTWDMAAYTIPTPGQVPMALVP
jgi:Lamin Tail Domain